MKNCDNTSVRPKVRTKHSEKPVGEALDKRSIRFEDRDSIERYSPALHIKFSHTMVFTKYSSPPFRVIADLKQKGLDLESNVLIRKWIENTIAFEEMIKTLLRLQHNQFWSTLINEKSLQICLESYLRFGPRGHDSEYFLLTDSMKLQIRRVHSLVFKLYHRICSFAESKANFISESTFGSLLYDNYLIDVPKIIDLSVLYSNTNFGQLLSQMLSTVLRCQPQYEEDLLKSCYDMSNALTLLRTKIGSDDNQFERIDKLSHLQLSQLQSLITRIADISVSLGSLIQTLPQMGQLFRIASIDKMIVEFYNKVFPSLQNQLNLKLSSFGDDLIAEQIRKQVMISRSYLILSFRQMIENCFLKQLMDKNSEKESKVCLIDELIECLTMASFERSFIYDYCLKFPVESDLSELSKHSEWTRFDSFDKTRIDYLKNVIQSSISSPPKRQNPDSVKVNGFAGIEDNEDVVGIDENDVELQSSVQYIREIMPELGSGFVELCLIHYNYDNERALNAILENTLPKHLSDLDRSLGVIEKNVRNNVVNHRCDRTEVVTTNVRPEPVPEVIQSRQNIFNSDEFDIFRNKNIDLSRIHSGKKEKTVTDLVEADKQKIIDFHYKQLEDEENQFQQPIEQIQQIDYNDEYDDTYEDDTEVVLTTDKLMDELDTNNAKEEDEDNGKERAMYSKPFRYRSYKNRHHK